MGGADPDTFWAGLNALVLWTRQRSTSRTVGGNRGAVCVVLYDTPERGGR